MTSLAQLREALDFEAQKETLDELREYANSDDELIEALRNDDDELFDKLPEIADRKVSIFNHEILQWAATNLDRLAKYEEDALTMGFKSIVEAVAFCWHQAELDDLHTRVKAIRETLEKLA